MLFCYSFFVTYFGFRLSPERHCILICNSPPYHLPSMEGCKYTGYYSDQLATMLAQVWLFLGYKSIERILHTGFVRSVKQPEAKQKVLTFQSWQGQSFDRDFCIIMPYKRYCLWPVSPRKYLVDLLKKVCPVINVTVLEEKLTKTLITLRLR